MHYFCLWWVSDKSHNFLYPTFTVFKQNDKPMRKSPKRRKNTYHYYYYYVALAKDEDDRAAFARSCVLSRIQWSERLYRSMMLKKSPAGVPPLVQCPHAFQIFHLNNPQLEKMCRCIFWWKSMIINTASKTFDNLLFRYTGCNHWFELGLALISL